MSPDETCRLINEDPDFINSKRFDNSLSKMLERYPDGTAPAKLVAQALMMSEDEVEEIYQGIVSKMRAAMKIELD